MDAAYRWPIMVFTGRDQPGGRLFGFLINRAAVYFMQGLNLTPLHGTALFGVYGMPGSARCRSLADLKPAAEERRLLDELLEFTPGPPP